MDHERAAAEFRAAARRAGPRGAGRRYPAKPRRVATEYLGQRQASGVAVSTIARELGVKRHTLLAWAAASMGAAARPEFLPVRVIADTDHGAPRSTIVVHGPGGLRIEGLDVAGVIALLRGLT